jgi:hypothetical protein
MGPALATTNRFGLPWIVGDQVNTALIVGSGPSAAASALALGRREDCKITVLDVGLRVAAKPVPAGRG